jgi:hypothetical protein
VVDVSVGDEDIADPEDIAVSKAADIARIEHERPFFP